ncbi:MAG: radical SAM protein [Clostridia bacterium]|nr:radical SAM protein [Clostridia bacterium]
MSKFIHLLYVPTMNCSMACRYCYLGENTKDLPSDKGYLETLRYAVEKLRAADVVPFCISLHGGEVTTLAREDFRDLVAYISAYYEENGDLLRENGFKVGRPHIKTNLYQIDKHLDAIRDYGVSISGSLDLPLSMHDRYRVTRDGRGTLGRIMENIALLADLPNHKKVSATVFHEHFERLDEIVSDIRYLADSTCLDMNDFNFMIGFTPQGGGDVQLTALPEEEQEQLYDRMQAEFAGTDLEEGLRHAWFAEFTPAYCSASDNCGDKFFLLEKNGDVYSCVRGQGNPDFYYGNIYSDSAEEILSRARGKIFMAHHRNGFPQECGACEHLHLCRTGCPYVKEIYGSGKSYTCRLQKRIYADGDYESMPQTGFVYHYLLGTHPELAEAYRQETVEPNSLPDLIARDTKLQKVYDPEAFILRVDDEEYPLQSQLTKRAREVVYLTPEMRVRIYVRRDVMEALSDYPVNNALYIMLLSGDMVVYGDEQREKQAHVMTHMIYRDTLAAQPSDKPGYYCAELGPLLALYGGGLSKEHANNLFFTTAALRDYHYAKQKENAFYHYQAMNLPFANMELYYIDWTGTEEAAL